MNNNENTFAKFISDLKNKFYADSNNKKIQNVESNERIISGYDSYDNKYYFNKRGNKLYLLSESDDILNSMEIEEKNIATLKGSLFLQMTGEHDVTSFGATMSAMINYEINDKQRLVFVSERVANYLLSNLSDGDKFIIDNDLEDLISNKQLQIKYNFILLHPICFIIDESNKTATYTKLSDISNEMFNSIKEPKIKNIDLRQYNVIINNSSEEIEDDKTEQIRKDKIIGSLMGGAVGDALGYQIEFKSGIKDREVTKYENDFGTISDDTQMTLFTANGLIWRETRGHLRGIAPLPPNAVYEAYLDWIDTQDHDNKHSSKVSWIKDIEELNIRRAPGTTCLNALHSGRKGTIEEPINDSKGCGGIMRVAPLGLYINSPENAGKFAAEISAITHGHPLGNIPSYVFATMLYFIVNDNLNIEGALDKAMQQYKEKFNVYEKEYNDYFNELVEKAIKLSKENMTDIEAINQIGEGWVAEETFAIAIYSCLKYQNSFDNAVICSVNHDGDSDSTGAVTGNIMGAYLGYNSIPKYYVDNLELKDVIYEIAEDLATEVPVGEYSSNRDDYWESKYVYCKRNLSLKK